jgi:ketosteroid isomerase-like protein
MATNAPSASERSANAELLARYQQAWTELDVDTIVDSMTPDAVYEASFGPEPWGERFVGRDQIREVITRFRAGEPSSHDYGEPYLFGDHGFATWTTTKTHPDGSLKSSVHGCDFYEFRDGLVAKKIAYRKGPLR